MLTPTPMKGSAAPPGQGAPEVSMTDVSGMISRVNGLPSDSSEVAQLTGRMHGVINNDPTLRVAALSGGSSLQSLILGQMSREMADLMDPARRAEAERQRKAQTANTTSSDAAIAGKLGAGLAAARALPRSVDAGSGKESGTGTGTSNPSSTAYARALGTLGDLRGNPALAAAAGALIKDGYQAADIKPILPYAKELGWNSKPDVKALVDSGKEFSGLTAKHERARKKGDKVEVQRTETEMRKRYEDTKDEKKRRGMEHIFRKLHIDTKPEAKAGNIPHAPNKSAEAVGKKVAQVSKAKSDDAAEGSFLAALDGAGASPSTKPPVAKAADASPGNSDAAKVVKSAENKPAVKIGLKATV